MSDAQTPCRSDPDKWYTEQNGRRYDDEILLTEGAIQEIMADLDGQPVGVVDEAIDDAESEAVRKRLIERRQARDACFTCPVRTICLGKALDAREQYGIWGGYYPEQRRAIERELDRRAELAAAAAEAVPAEE